MMPVVNAPFRLYYAYNPLIAQTVLQPPIVADRSLFPNQATFLNAVAQVRSASSRSLKRRHCSGSRSGELSKNPRHGGLGRRGIIYQFQELDLTVKNRVFVFCSVLLAPRWPPAAQTSAPTKVGIINIQQAIVSTTEGQKAAKELEEKSAPKKKELEKLQAEIAALRDQLSKMSSVGSEEQKRKLMGDIDQKTKSFNRQVEDAQAELDQDQNRVLNELGGRMLAVLDKYAKDNGYAVDPRCQLAADAGFVCRQQHRCHARSR